MGADLTASMLLPKEDLRPMGKGVHRTGFGFEFEVTATGEIASYWKEGINVGASGILQHHPPSDVTFVVLSNRESGAWVPIEMIERMIGGGDRSDDRS